MSIGIDYGRGQTNIDKTNGIRYGVLPMHDVLQAWCDSCAGYYGTPEQADCPKCAHGVPAVAEFGDTAECEECGHTWEIELPDCSEPISHFVDDGEYLAEQRNDDCDIFITKSPYYTRAAFCSPCAPGACYLNSPNDDGEKAYCFGHDWFDDGVAPYPVYSVETNEAILPKL